MSFLLFSGILGVMRFLRVNRTDKVLRNVEIKVHQPHQLCPQNLVEYPGPTDWSKYTSFCKKGTHINVKEIMAASSFQVGETTMQVAEAYGDEKVLLIIREVIWWLQRPRTTRPATL